MENMNKPKTKEGWLKFEQEFYESFTEEERDEIGAAAMPMVETCAYIRRMQNKEKQKGAVKKVP